MTHPVSLGWEGTGLGPSPGLSDSKACAPNLPASCLRGASAASELRIAGRMHCEHSPPGWGSATGQKFICCIHTPEVKIGKILADTRCSGFYDTVLCSPMHLPSLLLGQHFLCILLHLTLLTALQSSSVASGQGHEH